MYCTGLRVRSLNILGIIRCLSTEQFSRLDIIIRGCSRMNAAGKAFFYNIYCFQHHRRQQHATAAYIRCYKYCTCSDRHISAALNMPINTSRMTGKDI